MLTIVLLIASAAAAAPGVADEALDTPTFFAENDELRAYLVEAGENHPAIEALYYEWQAAMERVPQVRALDDPKLSLGQFLLSETSRFKVAIQQSFPWFGTRRARAEKAQEDAEAALARLVAERNRVFARVKRAYFQYAYLHGSIDVADAQTELLSYMEEVVRAKYALGLAEQDELLRVQIEEAQVEDQRDSLVASRPSLGAQLNEALGRTQADLPPWPAETVLLPQPPDVATLLTQARAANPDLEVYDHLAASQRQQMEIARKAGLPDFTIGLEYVSISKPRQIRPDRPYPATLNAIQRQLGATANYNRSALQATRRLLAGQQPGGLARQPRANALIDTYSIVTANEPMAYSDGGEDNLMISLSMNVPIWRKRVRAGIQEARHREQAAEAGRHSKALAIEAALHEAHFGFVDAQRRLDLYTESLLPKARETYESLQTNYAASAGAGFIDVLDSVQTLLAFELEKVRARRDLYIAGAELQLLTGGNWPQPGD